MDPDHAVDNEFQARQADTVVGNAGKIERPIRVSHVHHDFDGDFRQRVELDLLTLVFEQTLVYISRVTFGTRHRDFLSLLDGLGRIPAADYGGDAELTRDDRRVTGAAAAICHDRGGAFHNRLPIGIRHVGNQDITRLHASHFLHIPNDTRRPRANALSDTATRGENA